MLSIPLPRTTTTILLPLLALLLGATGCSRVPQPTPYGFSNQHKMQSVAHWDILARDTAEQIILNIRGKLSGIPGQCLYVQPGESTFDQAFDKLLRAHLLRFMDRENAQNSSVSPEFLLADSPDPACAGIKFSAQVIRHRAERIGRAYPGTMTFLTGAVAVMRNFSWYEAMVGAGLVTDILSGTASSVTNSEILITTEISRANRVISLRTDMYYINDEDRWHYIASRPMAGRPFPLEGGRKK